MQEEKETQKDLEIGEATLQIGIGVVLMMRIIIDHTVNNEIRRQSGLGG